MALDVMQSIEIIAEMENYIAHIRPEEKIRPFLDIAYKIEDQSIIIYEIRPSFLEEGKVMECGFAKVTFVKTQNLWKVFWLRSDLKWHVYTPCETVKKLKDFIQLVDEDKYACFKG